MALPSKVITSGYTAAESQWTGQRKVCKLSGNWYAFHGDAGHVSYKKSTDGGNTWGSTVDVDANTDNVALSIWVEGALIWVAWNDTSLDGIYMRSIDTASADALGTLRNTGDLGILDTTNINSVVVAGDGTHYVVNDSDPDVLKSTNDGANWTDITPSLTGDEKELLIPTGTGDDVLMIACDSSSDGAGDLWGTLYNGSSWGSEIQLTTSSDIHTSKGVTAVEKTDHDVVLGYVTENGSNFNFERKNYSNSGNSWSDGTDFNTNVASVLGVGITLDSGDNDIFSTVITGSAGAATGLATIYSDTASVGVIYRINSDASLNFDIPQSMGLSSSTITKSLKYTVQTTPTALTKSLRYAVQTTPTALTKSLQYSVQQPEEITKSLKYTVQTAVTITKSLKYCVQTTPAALTKGLIYEVQTAPAITKSLQYTVITSTAPTKSLKYTVITTASITKSLQYEVQGVTVQTITKDLQYAVKTSPSVTKSLKYTVNQPEEITKSLTYAVQTSATVTKQLIYEVKAAVSITKSLKYTVLTTPAAVTKSLQYAIGLTPSITKSLTYSVERAVSVTKSLQYTLQSPVSITKSLKYAVITTPTATTKSLQYAVAAASAITKSLKYTVPTTQVITKDLQYVIAGQAITITKSLTYAVQQSEEITKSLQYAVLTTVAITKSLTYAIGGSPVFAPEIGVLQEPPSLNIPQYDLSPQVKDTPVELNLPKSRTVQLNDPEVLMEGDELMEGDWFMEDFNTGVDDIDLDVRGDAPDIAINPRP